MMAFQMRHDPSNRKIKELLEQGAIGKVGLLRRRHCIPVLFDERFVTGPSRWHIDPDKNMGMFMDDASHATDFIHWLLGRPDERDGRDRQHAHQRWRPTIPAWRSIAFAGGAMAELVNSSVTLAGENTTEVYGDQGVIIQNHDDVPSTNIPLPPHPIALKLYTRSTPAVGGSGHPDPVQPRRTHCRCAARLCRLPAARSCDPPATAADGRASVEMVLGAYRSAQEGRRVHFPL